MIDKSRQKIAMYSPYLETYGGGERYFLQIASTLSKYHDVFIFGDPKIREITFNILNLSLEKVNFIPATEITRRNFISRYFFTRGFNTFIFMTNGSTFFSGAARNFIIIQSPLHIPSDSLLTRMKMKSTEIICYSEFMKEIIIARLKRPAIVFPPCIDLSVYRTAGTEKKNIILTVGRFFRQLHAKKQEKLVEIFIKNYDRYFQGWRLVVAGGLRENSGKKLVQQLKEQVRGYPVEIVVNAPSRELTGLYRSARMYWHATGFGEDLENHPEMAEHFGITILEAMAAKAVPLAFNAGGVRDIIDHKKNGYLWNTEKELVKYSSELCQMEAIREKLTLQAEIDVRRFSCTNLYEKLQAIHIV
jgi:glycosyltransferase involved in cell wall biosynthesis